MDFQLRCRARNGNLCALERGCGESHARIAREAEAFFGDAKKIAVELHVGVLVVDDGDGVAAGGNLEGELRLAVGDGETAVDDGSGDVVGPAGGSREDEAARSSSVVAESGDMQTERAERLSAGGRGVNAARIACGVVGEEGEREEHGAAKDHKELDARRGDRMTQDCFSIVNSAALPGFMAAVRSRYNPCEESMA